MSKIEVGKLYKCGIDGDIFLVTSVDRYMAYFRIIVQVSNYGYSMSSISLNGPMVECAKPINNLLTVHKIGAFYG